MEHVHTVLEGTPKEVLTPVNIHPATRRPAITFLPAAAVNTLNSQTPKKVLVYDSGNDGVFTCSGSSFESLLISLAGGQNFFDDLTDKLWITVSYDELLARKPDVILIHDYDYPSVEEKITEIKSTLALPQLDYVKNHAFAAITLESILPGDRMTYAVESMAADFFPELFPPT